MAELDHLWAGWKRAAFGTGNAADGRPLEEPARAAGTSLFESIEQSGLPDDKTYIVWRGERTFCILNVFPYTSGHCMVLPIRKIEHLNLSCWGEVNKCRRNIERYIYIYIYFIDTRNQLDCVAVLEITMIAPLPHEHLEHREEFTCVCRFYKWGTQH